MTNEWQPSANDLLQGREGYMQYVSGVTVLSGPDSDFSYGLHQRPLEENNLDAIIMCAEDLMFRGLTKVIKFANEPANRSPIAKAERQFETALPHMNTIVSTTYETQAERLGKINSALAGFRPMPLYEEPLYHLLCHSRLGKIGTQRLMGGILPAPVFGDRLAGRTLNAPNRRGRHQD